MNSHRKVAGAVAGALALMWASGASADALQMPVQPPFQASHDVPTPVAAELIAAMAQQQQAVSALMAVQVQTLMALQDISNTLRQIQAAQATGAAK